MSRRRDPVKTEERPWRAAQRQGNGNRTEAKDSTEPTGERARVSKPSEGKSRWRRLADVISLTPWRESA